MASIPTATEIINFLEGYVPIRDYVTDTWINNRRDGFIIPWIKHKFGFDIEAEETKIEYYDGNGTNTLILNNRNINSLERVEYVTAGDNVAEIGLAGFLLDSSEGVVKAIRSESVSLSQRIVFPKGKKNIKITYKVGFGSGELPIQVKEGILYLTSEWILGFLEGRSGGGDSVCERNFGKMGKYSNIRIELARKGISILNDYMTSVVGS